MKTLFKNGTIYDGTGNKPCTGDVLIEDDRIAAVGGSITEAADRIVDITGCQICPGLIDAHSHNDFFYDREDAEKFYRPFIEQGITTQITGNCSFSPFGVDPDTPYRDKIGGGLFDAASPCRKTGAIPAARQAWLCSSADQSLHRRVAKCVEPSFRTSDRCHWCGNPSFLPEGNGLYPKGQTPRPVCELVSQ